MVNRRFKPGQSRRVKASFKILGLILIFTLLLSACDFLAEIAPPEPIAGDGLTVFFIDVGQADAALLTTGGEAMLIDGGNVADSDLIYAFLKNHGITHLNYIVATHAHEDHAGGLSGALNYAGVDMAMSPVTSDDSKFFGDFVKYLDADGVSITVPKPGDSFSLGEAEVLVVGIDPEADANNSSIVLKVTYGGVSFLFTGDAERGAEQIMLDSGLDLSSTVLKVGHHGSDTSTSYPFLREVAPQYAVISCGKDNSYGHPHEETMSRLRDADVTVYRTDQQGTIICQTDGAAISFEPERNANVQTNPTENSFSGESYYIGNVKSLKFHRPSCENLPLEANSVKFESLEDAQAAGYIPCGNCKP